MDTYNQEESHLSDKAAAMGQDPSALENITSPQDWPLIKKIHASAASWFFTFTLLNSLTCYAAGVVPVTEVFSTSMEKSILGFSLFLVGIAFAPLYTPHVSERLGRNIVYWYSTIGMSVFLLGAAYSKTITQLTVTRFFAGFLGGPIVVNVEGTFADLWDPRHTVSWYSFLAAAQYIGASVGPIVCGPVLGATGDWRYTQFIPLMFALASLLFGLAAPETYPREIARRQARSNKMPANLTSAPTGKKFPDMIRYTLFNPIIMLVSEPLVILSAISLMANFAMLFSLFIVVPPTLVLLYGLDPYYQGIAFLSGFTGSAIALIATPLVEQLTRPIFEKSIGMMKCGVVAVEYRLVPAVIGNLFMLGGAFWIAYTAAPPHHEIVPVAGTAFFVCGSLMHVISVVSYFFDVFPKPQSILSALTAMAVLRVLSGGLVSLFFLQAFLNLGGKWAFQIFGIIFCVLAIWPALLIALGPKIRSMSSFAKDTGVNESPMTAAIEQKDSSS